MFAYSAESPIVFSWAYSQENVQRIVPREAFALIQRTIFTIFFR